MDNWQLVSARSPLCAGLEYINNLQEGITMNEKQFYHLLLSLGWDEWTAKERRDFSQRFLALLENAKAE